jgi:hypothetical protein
MRFKALFFDLDETLYPATNGLWKAIRERIHAYMLERMEFPPEKIQALREKYFREYGTTLRGLQINHSVDLEEYLAFVHDVPLDQYLQPDPEQRRLIESLPVKKYIFTGSCKAWTCRDVLTASWMCTPSPRTASRCRNPLTWHFRPLARQNLPPVSCSTTSPASHASHVLWGGTPFWWGRIPPMRMPTQPWSNGLIYLPCLMDKSNAVLTSVC